MNNQSEKLSLKGLKFGAIQVDISNYILKLTLNRPDKKNAINEMMGNELAYCLAFAKQDKSIRVVIIQAKGDVFCSGGDLRRNRQHRCSVQPDLGELRTDGDPHDDQLYRAGPESSRGEPRLFRGALHEDLSTGRSRNLRVAGWQLEDQ